ncbi:MAG TPA: xanthine dehydrogenase family protein subunit M [Stellaceae bacterium]|nr:xanthine dehydrogenase family protein subunit M [Stellaceae bacterium]
MKPAAFDYFCPESLGEAVALLGGHGDEAKLLAGGQSLMPLLNFRMLRPGALIDINRLSELDFVAEHPGGLRIGALSRHHTLETSPLVRERFPVLSAAMAHVAHLAIRNRGTIGGSLSHADPAAELPLLAVLLDAELRTRSAAGERRHLAADFFLGPLTTALGADEMVTEIVLPGLPPGTGWGFEEVALRDGDFAIAAVAALVTVADGQIVAARLAAGGVDAVPRRLAAAEAALIGERPSAELIALAGELARGEVDPPSDLHASAGYRRHLVAALAERALSAAVERAG